MLTVIAVFIALTPIIIIAAAWGPQSAAAPATMRARWPGETDPARQ